MSTSLPDVTTASATSKTSGIIITSSTESNLPSATPEIILPQSVDTQPGNSTLVQLGWGPKLNWPFVVRTPDAVQQLFDLVPAAIAYAIDQSPSLVVTQYLQPYDTLEALDYITTMYMLYIPSESVSGLSLALLNPGSKLYQNANGRTQTLMSLLRPEVPLLAGNAFAGGGPVNTEIATDTAVVSTFRATGTLLTGITSSATSLPSSTASQGSNSSAGDSQTLPKWGIAVLDVGLVLLCVLTGALFFYYRKSRRYRKARTSDRQQVEIVSVQETKSFLPRGELPASLGGMNMGSSSTATAGALHSKPELATATYDRHAELDGRWRAQSELNTNANRHELDASDNPRFGDRA